MQKIASENKRTDLPSFNVGDKLRVKIRIKDGDKSRLQAFEGNVIAKQHGGNSESFTLRRVIAGQGVERTFPLQCPSLQELEVLRKGKVRRAKLYYLREKIGKAARIKELM